MPKMLRFFNSPQWNTNVATLSGISDRHLTHAGLKAQSNFLGAAAVEMLITEPCRAWRAVAESDGMVLAPGTRPRDCYREMILKRLNIVY